MVRLIATLVLSVVAATPDSAIRDQIQQLDQTIAALADAPPTVGRLGQVRAFASAQRYLAQRQALLSKLENSAGVPAPSVKEELLAARLQLGIPALAMQLEAEGPAYDLGPELISALEDLGYQPSGKPLPEPDVLVSAASRFERSPSSSEDDLDYVRAIILVVVKDGRTRKPLAQFEESFRYGGRGEIEAEKKAERYLAARVRKQAAKRVDSIIRGDPLK